ncbi:amidase [Fusarium phyllophilum]|uniref:Amidase n=1 Tax=Fusarium phyllophilum TaxID=47803 RepID=A0A8H5II98_9HYPO|nr:amidase [Fusarium phyllophilum]
MLSSPYKLTATHALDLLKNNTISVEAYASSLLERIRENDHTVKAWAHLGIKDIMNTKDMPTQFGSPIYDGYQPASDSAAVAILRASGALIFGKTTTTEFTVKNSGPETTNPLDPNRTPGGSSCGSAAAVADLQVPLSLGAQTGGKTLPFAPTFDTFGFFGRSIEDLQLLADVFALQDDKPPRDMPLDEISVALIKTPMWCSAGPGTISAMDEAATILKNNNVQVEEVSFPADISDVQELKRIQKVITLGEAQVSFLREYRIDKGKLADEICDIVENASNITHEERIEASDRYSVMRDTIDDLARRYTVILTPSAVDEAPLGLDDMGSATFNTLWTGFHMPVVNIPAFAGANDMPVGISLVGPRFRDQQLLRTSQLLSDILGPLWPGTER